METDIRLAAHVCDVQADWRFKLHDTARRLPNGNSIKRELLELLGEDSSETAEVEIKQIAEEEEDEIPRDRQKNA